MHIVLLMTNFFLVLDRLVSIVDMINENVSTVVFLELIACIAVPLTEARRRKIALENDPDCRRASSRGLIPKAKVKTIKMTFVIVFGELPIMIYQI